MTFDTPAFRYISIALFIFLCVGIVFIFQASPDPTEDQARSWLSAEASIQEVKFTETSTTGNAGVSVFVLVRLKFSYLVGEEKYEVTRMHRSQLSGTFPKLPNIKVGDTFTLRYDPNDSERIFYLDQFPRLR